MFVKNWGLKVARTWPRVLPFCAQQFVAVTSRRRPVCVAVFNTSRANPFLLFIGKERRNRATPHKAQIRSHPHPPPPSISFVQILIKQPNQVFVVIVFRKACVFAWVAFKGSGFECILPLKATVFAWVAFKGSGFECILPVSYTHLTLPTRRTV